MGLGLSKLDAVNEMLEAIGQTRFSALSSSGSWPTKSYNSDIAGTAEQILDRVSREVQSQGFEFNTLKSKAYTIGAPGAITFASNVLAIKPAGPTQFKNIAIRGSGAYDLEGDTAVFAAGTYYFDVIVVLDFDDCSPRGKDAIVKAATQVLQRRFRGDPQRDQEPVYEQVNAQVRADRPKASDAEQPLGKLPVLPQIAGQGGNGR